jgi:DNA replication protein DnaC
LRALLADELAGRRRSTVAMRRRAASFPTGKTFESWDDAICSMAAPTLRSLRGLEWVSRHENLVVCGPSGTGKSHLLEALGSAAIEAGHHVSWFFLEDLGTLLYSHRADGTMARARVADHGKCRSAITENVGAA